jgi:hypothetical protein
MGTQYSGDQMKPKKAIPSKNDETGPDMRINNPPHKTLKLKDDVGNVEDCQQPAVSIAFEIKIFLHAGNFGITDVRTIQE